jgi:SAM-dependent methyltransferase
MLAAPEKDTRRLYSDLAWTWPIIRPVEDYVKETETFSRTLKQEAKIEVKNLLHLGCGGGHNDYTFKRYFALIGIDISEEMLTLARKLNPEVKYHKDDMRTIRLGEVFDAIAIAVRLHKAFIVFTIQSFSLRVMRKIIVIY